MSLICAETRQFGLICYVRCDSCDETAGTYTNPREALGDAVEEDWLTKRDHDTLKYIHTCPECQKKEITNDSH